MHGESPVIFRLGTHRRGKEMREFQQDGDIQQLVAEEPETQFTAWMTRNVRCPDGRHLLYADYCEEFTWNQRRNSPGTRGRRPGQGGSGIMREAAKSSEGSTRSGRAPASSTAFITYHHIYSLHHQVYFALSFFLFHRPNTTIKRRLYADKALYFLAQGQQYVDESAAFAKLIAPALQVLPPHVAELRPLFFCSARPTIR
jgi:hypothetical protein